MKFLNFTADEILTIGKVPRNTTLGYVVKGGFGGGTATFGTRDPADNFVPFTDPAPVTAAKNGSFFAAKGTDIAVQVSGSTTPTLEIAINGDYFEYVTGIYQR